MFSWVRCVYGVGGRGLRRPFRVDMGRLRRSPLGRRRRAFFRLICVLSKMNLRYVGGDGFGCRRKRVFLVAPRSYRSFSVRAAAGFLFVHFGSVCVRSSFFKTAGVGGLRFVLRRTGRRPDYVLGGVTSGSLMGTVVRTLVERRMGQSLCGGRLVRRLVGALVIVIAHGVTGCLPRGVSRHSRRGALSVLRCVRGGVCGPGVVGTSIVDRRFNVSRGCLKHCFGGRAGRAVRRCVVGCGLGLVRGELLRDRVEVGRVTARLNFASRDRLGGLFGGCGNVVPSRFEGVGLW